jgi:anti-anti-sigma factor
VTDTAAATNRDGLGFDAGDGNLVHSTIRVAHFVVGETGVIKVDGHLDAVNAVHLQRALDRFTGRRVRRMRRLAFDLAAVTFIDEAGFRPIAMLNRSLHGSVAIEIIEPSPPVHRFLARTGRPCSPSGQPAEPDAAPARFL